VRRNDERNKARRQTDDECTLPVGRGANRWRRGSNSPTGNSERRDYGMNARRKKRRDRKKRARGAQYLLLSAKHGIHEGDVLLLKRGIG
jgi:hypothetical protein